MLALHVHYEQDAFMGAQTNRDIAVEEWKLLQTIIGRMETTRHTIRNWVVTLQVAFAVGYLSLDFGLSGGVYYIAAVGALVPFLLLESLYRLAEVRAMKRSAHVEASLRGETDYDGPRINQSLAMPAPMSVREQVASVLHQALIPRVFLSYFVLASVASAVALVGPVLN